VQECSRALGLQGYEYYHCSVTLQLCRIDHGLCVRDFFVLFSALNHNSGIKTDLCIVVLVQLECIVDVGIVFLIVTLLFASVHICGIVGLQMARDRPYAYSYSRLVPQLTYDTYHICGLEGVSFSSLVDMIFAMEGP
jgi:hypothetical protein